MQMNLSLTHNALIYPRIIITVLYHWKVLCTDLESWPSSAHRCRIYPLLWNLSCFENPEFLTPASASLTGLRLRWSRVRTRNSTHVGGTAVSSSPRASTAEETCPGGRTSVCVCVWQREHRRRIGFGCEAKTKKIVGFAVRGGVQGGIYERMRREGGMMGR